MIRTWHITPTQNIELRLDVASLDDVTRQLPDGYYSTFRTYKGCTRVLRLTDHLRRLYEPVSAPEMSAHDLRRQLLTLLEPFRPGEARVRAMMTKQGQAYIALMPLEPLPRDVYEHGVRVETIELQREHPRLKSTTFIDRSAAERKQIAREGIFEALLVKDGKILEGMTSNFFYIMRASTAQRETILGTARADILLGVTRKTVISLARRAGLEVKYQPLRREQATAVSEAFLTSSSRGIVPITQLDSVKIGTGSPGPITKELIAAYEAYVVERTEKI